MSSQLFSCIVQPFNQRPTSAGINAVKDFTPVDRDNHDKG